jgi:hypothetical protein
MEVRFLDADSPPWMDLLSGMRHDVYQLPAYVRFAARWQERGDPCAFVAEEDGRRLLVPLIVRPIPSDLADDGPQQFDATCPRGYPGPLVEIGPGRDDDGFLDRAVDAFVEALRGRSIVSAFIRIHPLLSPPMAPLQRTGVVVDHGHSTSIDLTLTDEELWRQTNHGHRSGINKAKKLGYVGRIDDDWSRFDGFVDLYQRTMARLDADPFWRLSPAYFEDLRASIPRELHLCVVEEGRELAAAALLTEVDGIVEYHLSGSADAHSRVSPTKLLIDAARTWAKGRGNRWLHLAGSPRPDDSLAEFKAGFSPLRFPVRSWRLIADPRAYEALTGTWRSSHHVPPDPADGYFPAYRRPPARSL